VCNICVYVYVHDVYLLHYISNVGFLSFFIPFNPFIARDFLKLIHFLSGYMLNYVICVFMYCVSW
jgi:hypothetical protein